MRFIRKNGRIIPIETKERAITTAQNVGTATGGYLLGRALRKASLKSAIAGFGLSTLSSVGAYNARRKIYSSDKVALKKHEETGAGPLLSYFGGLGVGLIGARNTGKLVGTLAKQKSDKVTKVAGRKIRLMKNNGRLTVIRGEAIAGTPRKYNHLKIIKD